MPPVSVDSVGRGRGHSQVSVQLGQRRDEIACCGGIVVEAGGHPERAGAVGIAGRCRADRGRRDVRQQHGVRKTLCDTEMRADRPAHSVYESDIRIRERHPRGGGGEHHLLAGLEVVAIGVGAAQHAADGDESEVVGEGFAFALTYASMAWVSSSTPVSAVRRGGIETVSS